MEVILLETVDTLGVAGDVVKVKDGYARNMLIPQCKAMACTKANKKAIDEQKKIIAIKEEKGKQKLELIAKKISSLSCTIKMQAGEEDKLFGSVTNADIHEVLLAEGIDIDKRKIEIEEPIKALGVYTVTVVLHSDIKVPLKVWVVQE